MRIIVRCYGLIIILVVSIMMFAQMMIFNVRRDELVNCISIAMSNTQILLQEQIEDEIYGTHTKRKEITSNKQYLEEFSQCFYKLIVSDSQFNIKVYGIDYTKGLLDIEVESTFQMFNGHKKTMKSRKTSIIDIREGGNKF